MTQIDESPRMPKIVELPIFFKCLDHILLALTGFCPAYKGARG
jgi:hypothetical protein